MDYKITLEPLLTHDPKNRTDSVMRSDALDISQVAAYYSCLRKTIYIVSFNEDEAEATLNHEVLHHVLAKATRPCTSFMFDNIEERLIRRFNLKGLL